MTFVYLSLDAEPLRALASRHVAPAVLIVDPAHRLTSSSCARNPFEHRGSSECPKSRRSLVE